MKPVCFILVLFVITIVNGQHIEEREFTQVGKHVVVLSASVRQLYIEVQAAGGGGGATTPILTGRGGDGGDAIEAWYKRSYAMDYFALTLGRGGDGATALDMPGQDGEDSLLVMNAMVMRVRGGKGAFVECRTPINKGVPYVTGAEPMCGLAGTYGRGGNGGAGQGGSGGRGGHGWARVFLYHGSNVSSFKSTSVPIFIE
jgi:hypothetical protein